MLRAEQLGQRVRELVGERARGLVGLDLRAPAAVAPAGQRPPVGELLGLGDARAARPLLARLQHEVLAPQELLRLDDERPVELDRPRLAGAAAAATARRRRGIVELVAQGLHEAAGAVEVVAHRLLLVPALRGDLLDPVLVVGPRRERAPVLAAFALDRAVDLEVLQHALEPAAADVHVVLDLVHRHPVGAVGEERDDGLGLLAIGEGGADEVVLDVAVLVAASRMPSARSMPRPARPTCW